MIRITRIVMKIFQAKTCHSSPAIALLAILICLAYRTPVAASDNFRLSVGYMGSVYQEMTNNEIKAAVSVLLNKIAWKNFGKSEAFYYETIADMAREIKNGRVQVVCLPPEQFLLLRQRVPLEPLLVTATSIGTESELLLLVRKDSGISSLKDLKGKTLVFSQQKNVTNSLSRVWLETMLLQLGHHDIDKYFSSVKVTPTASRVVLPVFFHQADACVVTRQFFELAAELNPQIERELTAIARIESLAQGIISVDTKVPRESKQKVKEAFLALNQSPEGRQLLILFQVNSFTPFRPGYLKATEALYTEHQRLRNRIVRR